MGKFTRGYIQEAEGEITKRGNDKGENGASVRGEWYDGLADEGFMQEIQPIQSGQVYFSVGIPDSLYHIQSVRSQAQSR